MAIYLNSGEKGTGAAVYAVALARASGDRQVAAKIVARDYPGNPAVERALTKAAIPIGTATDAGWAEELVDTSLSSDLALAVRERELIGRLSMVRRVPFQTIVPVETAGASGNWTTTGAPIPVQKSTFTSVTLPAYRGSVIVPITRELRDLASLSAITAVRQSIVRGVASFFDAQFIDPDIGLVADTSPASITNGATSVAGSGLSTAAGMAADVAALIDAADDMVSPVWIMRATTCARMSATLGLPGIKITNGELAGIPIVCTKAVPAPVGSPSMPRLLVLLDQDAVLLADEGQFDIQVSNVSMLQMNDSPGSGPQAGVSLFQTETSATRVSRRISWQRTRATGVAFCEVTY